MSYTDTGTIEDIEPMTEVDDLELDHTFTTDARQYTKPTPEEVRAGLLRIEKLHGIKRDRT